MPIGIGTGLAIAGGTGLAAAGIGAAASMSAADKQAQAASAALGQQQSMFNSVQAANQPFIDTGNAAQTSLAQLYGLTTPGNPGGASSQNQAWTNFTNLPAYQFPLQQGLLGLQRNLNAQGLGMSGAATKEAQQYGQGLASQYLTSNYVNPLLQLGQTGANSAASLGGTAANFSNSMAQTQMGIGQAQASGIVGAANSVNGGLQGIGNLGLYSALAKSGAQNSVGNPVGGGLSSYTNTYGAAGPGFAVPTFPS